MARLPSARAPTAPASARPTWTPRRKSRSSPPTTPPEYGRSSGGQIRIITRSGGQQFHGAAYEYVRNTVVQRQHLDAQPHHRPGVPAARQGAANVYNQFGYNIGGPFYIPGKFNKDKSKFFWYWGQEWVRYRFLDTAHLDRAHAADAPGQFQRTAEPYKRLLRQGGTRSKTRSPGIPFPETSFPRTAQPERSRHPEGLSGCRTWPRPSTATQLFYFAAIHPQNQRKDTLAVDMNLTDKQRLQFRRKNYAFWEYQPLDGTPTERRSSSTAPTRPTR